jgi:hypothetical protein
MLRKEQLSSIEAKGYHVDESLELLYLSSSEKWADFAQDRVLATLRELKEKNLENDPLARKIVFAPKNFLYSGLGAMEHIAAYEILKTADLEKEHDIADNVYPVHNYSVERARQCVEGFNQLSKVNLDLDSDIRRTLFTRHRLNVDVAGKTIAESSALLIEAKLLQAVPNHRPNQDILLTLLNNFTDRITQAQTIINAFAILKVAQLDNDLTIRAVILFWSATNREAKARVIVEAMAKLQEAKLDQIPEIRHATIHAPMYKAKQVAESFIKGSYESQVNPARFFTPRTNLTSDAKQDIKHMLFEGKPTEDYSLDQTFNADMLAVHLHDKSDEELQYVFDHVKILLGKVKHEMDVGTFKALLEHANPISTVKMSA